MFGRWCECCLCAARGARFFAFAETVLFSSIPCFLFVFRCSVHHSAKNAPLLSIRAFDTAENEFLQVYPSLFKLKIEDTCTCICTCICVALAKSGQKIYPKLPAPVFMLSHMAGLEC